MNDEVCATSKCPSNNKQHTSQARMQLTAPIKHLAVLAFLCYGRANTQQLPYNPTFAFTSSDPNIVYLLAPSADDSTYQLSSVNTSSQLLTSHLPETSISSSLPFKLDSETALAATLDTDDNLYLLSGACGSGVSGSSLWTYNGTAPVPTNGGWAEKRLDTAAIKDPTSNGGLNFLGSIMAFSGGGSAGSDLYFFGGICPNSTSATAANWQSSGSYSNDMLLLQSSHSDSSQYTLSNLITRSPPIPEAGFSVSPLEPAYLNSSRKLTGSQQNYAFVGGQTSTAFINMSQVAMLSLPEQSWSFIPIDGPANSGHGSKDETTIDPRSGHAAALSSDGRRIFVLGGWIGDVNTPAEPPLLILEVGEGFGGTGDWQWTVPGLASGGPSGLFGHAIAMLPGDILMVTGGYTIPSSGSGKTRKRADVTPNTATYFFNTSANAWISKYQNPEANMDRTPNPTNSGSSSLGFKLGIGIGLGLGLTLLILLIGGIFLCRRRLRRRRQERDRRVLEASVNTSRYQQQIANSEGIDGRGGSTSAGLPMQERRIRNPHPWAPTPAAAGDLAIARGSEAERTGLLFDIPSPTRGLRRSLHSRSNNYWPDDNRRTRGSGHIHPINEEDEGSTTNEENQTAQAPPLQPLVQVDDNNIVTAAPVFDPFADPRDRHLLDGSRSPSPQSSAQEREQEYQGWMNDWAAAENRRQMQAGRNSPDKSDRTSSSLSDSAHSAVSALSFQPSVNRTSSQRSGNLLATSLHSSPPRVSPPDSPTTPSHSRRSNSLSLNRRSRNEDPTTPGPSFPRLQAEGQALLGGTPLQSDLSHSPTRQSRAKSLMGSVRRALAGGHRNSIASSDAATPSADAFAIPQRSASAGSMLWKSKQGAKDWDYEGASVGVGSPSSRGARGDDEEWDVEDAIERRVVQVMFTVPREKLRVVNAGVDGASIASVEAERGELEQEEPLIDVSEEKGKGRAEEESRNQDEKR